MRDDTEPNYTVTNSFLVQNLAVLLIGGAVDYNIKDPNVVSADALVPCYKTASISVNLNENQQSQQ
jgi:hypothetical protein